MKLFDLTGRVAIVTGGNGGIGLGIARGLAQAGAAIVVAGRNVAKNAAAVKELEALGARATAIEVDVRDEASCRAMVAQAAERFGRIDILVNNAGTNIRKLPQDYALAEWREVLDTNLTSAFLCSQAAYPEMVKAGGGKIISIGSMLSIFGGPLMVALRREQGRHRAAHQVACRRLGEGQHPGERGPARLDQHRPHQRRAAADPGLNERVLARTPAGRWGEPGDFAGIAVFLASAASDFVTGTAIPVDGGYSVHF